MVEHYLNTENENLCFRENAVNLIFFVGLIFGIQEKSFLFVLVSNTDLFLIFFGQKKNIKENQNF